MKLAATIPRQSRPFVRAAFREAFGMGLAGGVVTPFAGVPARRMGAGDGLMVLLAMAPFLGFPTSMRITRLSTAVGWGRRPGIMRAVSYVLPIAFAAVTGPVAFSLLAKLFSAAGSAISGLGGSLLRMQIRASFRSETFKIGGSVYSCWCTSSAHSAKKSRLRFCPSTLPTF